MKKSRWRWCTVAAIVKMAALFVLAPAFAQGPPNLPPSGAYLPIPNFTGVGAGAQFRAAINDRFAGTQQIAPAVVSPAFANLPTEQDGLLVYCADCERATPCVSGGSGAWALGTRGQWSCSTPPLETALNANGNKVSSLASATTSGDAIAFGQTGAQLNTLLGARGDGTDSISNFNVNGVFNVRAFGAKGDNTTDDTTAIQNTYNAACTAATSNPTQAPTVYLPAGRYLTSFPIIMNCSSPIHLRGDGEQASVITAGQGLFPILYLESPQNAGSIGTFTATSLATGAGNSLNFPTGANWYLRLNDVTEGNSPGSPFETAAAINGMNAFSVEMFFKYTGTSNGAYYLISSRGSDLDQPVFGAMDLFLTQSGSGNTLSGCLTTSGSGRICISNAGSVSANAVHEVEFNYNGSGIRLFLDGTQIGSTVAASGTIVQQAAEEFALGALSNFQGNINPGGLVWAGQLDSIRISNVARHTSAFSAPTSKFSSDTNTAFLTNIDNTVDTLVQVDSLFGTGAKPWMPIRNWALVGNSTQNRISDLRLLNGTFGVLGVGTLYPNLDHLIVGGTVASVDFYNNCYGGHFEHLFLNPASGSQAGLQLQDNSGLVQASWLTIFPGAYGMMLQDSGGTYSQLFITPGAQTINDVNAGSSVVYHDYVFQEPEIDFENGGSQIPLRLYGDGTYEVVGGDLQLGNQNAAQLFPGNNPLTLTLVGTHVETGTSPAALLDFVAGGQAVESPVTWISPVINGKSLIQSGVTLATDPTQVQAIADTSSIQQMAGARNDGGNAISNYSVNGVQNVRAYGASCSIATASATTQAGNTSITVSAVGDFAVGQHVKLDHAGVASALTAPTIANVQLSSYANNPHPTADTQIEGSPALNCNTDSSHSPFHNATCTTSYCYSIVNVASNGSWSAPSAASCVSGGPAVVSSNNNIQVGWTTDPNALGSLIFRCTGTSCTPSTLYAVLPNLPVGQASAGTFTYVDMGNSFGQDEDFGNSRQSGSVPADLLTTITAISGTTITLANAPSQAGTFTLRHDDAPAFQAAINASCIANGHTENCGTVFVPACGNPYPLGQTVSFYGLLGAGLRGAGDTGQGAWATQIQWDGPTGGILFNLNKSGWGSIEDLGIPGVAGNTPGIVFNNDNYNGTGPGATLATTGTTPTRWTFRHNECGSAGVCFTVGTGAIVANVENMTYDGDWVDAPASKGGWSGWYGANAESYNEVIDGGQAGDRDFGMNFPHVGSFGVRDINLTNNIIDLFSQSISEYGTLDRGVSESAQYFVYSTGSVGQLSVKGFRLGDVAGPNGYLMFIPHGNLAFEDSFVDTNFSNSENIAIDPSGSDGAAVFINNLFGNALKNDGVGGNYPQTPFNSPLTDTNGGQRIPQYIEIGDHVSDSSASVFNAVPFVITGRTGGSLPVVLTNGNIVSMADPTGTNAAPTLSSCGSSPAIGSTSTNTAFTITVGSGTVTSCGVSFASAQPFVNPPVCTIQDVTQGITLKQSSLTNAGVTLGVPSGVSSVGGDTINATCVGK